MKNRLLLTILLSVCLGGAYAQVNFIQPISSSTYRASFVIQVCSTRTTHLIFPHEIKYADLGSKTLVGEVVATATNVFRIKSAMSLFPETSLTVITSDGCLYTFRVLYDAEPVVITYDLTKLTREAEVPKTAKVGTGSAARLSDKLNSLGVQAMDSRRRIKHVGHQLLGMNLYLKNVLYKDDVMFLVLGMENESKLDYGLDFVKLFVAQTKQAGESSAAQEVPLEPIKIFDEKQRTVPNRQELTKVIAISRMTLEKDRRLMVQVNEQGGGRLLTLAIGPEELAYAKPL
ncbi:conjugative transposon protein TraN [Nibrella saemangeumensis]|uniref:Conjugative transposon protein TraN n=1 Tax=Nibrella saemangeumensis TaxID=1084526 RepID=A0ABP8NF58_9BACT